MLEIQENQAVKLMASLAPGTRAQVEKDGLVFPSSNADLPDPVTDPLVIAGPARIRVFGLATWYDGKNLNFFPPEYVFQSLPEAVDPQTTAILPPGPQGGLVELQGSTNLADWFTVSPGVYTNLSAAEFFRVRVAPSPK